MIKKIKYGKILAVIFLTVLIWVWADLAVDKTITVSSARITVAESINPALWVSFTNEHKPSVPIEQIELKGPASRTAKLKRRLEQGSLILECFLDPEQENMTTGGQYTLNILDFLKKRDQIKQHGLNVISCKPEQLTVNVVQLVPKSLEVRCVDKDNNLVKTETINPTEVRMYVPEDWQGENLRAKVQLTPREIRQARITAIQKKPYIELAPGHIRFTPNPVAITTTPEEDLLEDYTITTAVLGFSFSANLQGKYRVNLLNPDSVISAITIKATPEARRAYEQMRYQVILEIEDEDAKSEEPLRRQLIYNFPPEYLRNDEIRLNQQPVSARFELISLTSQQQP